MVRRFPEAVAAHHEEVTGEELMLAHYQTCKVFRPAQRAGDPVGFGVVFGLCQGELADVHANLDQGVVPRKEPAGAVSNAVAAAVAYTDDVCGPILGDHSGKSRTRLAVVCHCLLLGHHCIVGGFTSSGNCPRSIHRHRVSITEPELLHQAAQEGGYRAFSGQPAQEAHAIRHSGDVQPVHAYGHVRRKRPVLILMPRPAGNRPGLADRGLVRYGPVSCFECGQQQDICGYHVSFLSVHGRPSRSASMAPTPQAMAPNKTQ
jgi:hypothetical protein